ncbi:MAG: carbon monoxide dehydrogenase [Nitrospirota bacterium]
MAYSIALAGKGGTGKTSITGLIVRYLIEKRRGPVLAVDADANANLNEILGVNVHATVGAMREQSMVTVRSGVERPGGMSMEELFDYSIQQTLIESKGFDLLVMGRPEGPGCYCAANNIIRKYTDKLADTYPYVVMDNEAGLEHLSRRTTQNVDLLLIISDPTVRGIMTAKRINDLCDELELAIRRRGLIINRVTDNIEGDIKRLSEREGLSLFGIVPADDLIFEYDLQGKPLITLPEDSRALRALYNILDELMIP